MLKKKWILAGCFIAVAALICAVTYAEKSEKLPAAVEAAVKAAFPNLKIEKFAEEEQEIEAYEVELKDAAMIVAEDGTVVSIETVEDQAKLPEAVASAIKSQNAKVVKVEKEVKKAEFKLVKLDNPVTTYEAKINKDGKDIEVQIALDGKIMKQKPADNEEMNKDKNKDKD